MKRCLPTLLMLVLLGGLLPAGAAWAQDDAPPPPRDDNAPPPPRDDHRPRFGDRGRDRGRDWPMTKEQWEQRLAVLRELNPELAERVQEWRDKDPEQVQRLVGSRLGRLLHELMELKTTDPPLFELRIQDVQLSRKSYDLAQRLHEAMDKSDQKLEDKTRQQLHEVVEQHFDVRQKMRQHELEKLEQRLEELRAGLEARQDARDELIDKRIETLIGNNEQAQW